MSQRQSLRSVLGEEDYAWLCAEAAAVASREAAYDDLDGLGGLLGGSSSSEEDEEDEQEEQEGEVARLSRLFDLSRMRRWTSPLDSAHALEYTKSTGATGHGDVLWAAGEYVASRVLAGEFFWRPDDDGRKDLAGVRVCELGAGVGLPSLACLARGAAEVLATDAPTAASIASLAINARRASLEEHEISVRRHLWGAPLLGGRRFDLVVVCDCIYNPSLHGSLLTSIAALLERSPAARAIVAFALHGNARDDLVLGFFAPALLESFGLETTKVDATQLRLSSSMRAQGLAGDDETGLKRAFVHTFLLSWKKKQAPPHSTHTSP